MSINQIILLIFIFVIFLACFLAILISKKKYKLDEVKIKAQNFAYKTVLVFSVSYNILLFILDVLDVQVASFKIQIIIGLFITYIVFICICVFKDVFIFPNKYGNLNLVSTGGIAIVYSIYGFINSVQTNVKFFEQGKLNDDIIYPLMGLLGLSLIIIFFIKLLINERTHGNKECKSTKRDD